MDEAATVELEAAQTAVLSAIHKSERVCETLDATEPPRAGQRGRVERDLKALYMASALLSDALTDTHRAEYPPAELAEGIERMKSFVCRIESVSPRLKRGSPQATLAARRIRAFTLAASLMERALAQPPDTAG